MVEVIGYKVEILLEEILEEIAVEEINKDENILVEDKEEEIIVVVFILFILVE